MADIKSEIPGRIASEFASEPVGVLLLVLAVLCCATYTVISRGLSGSADPLFIVTTQQTAGLGWSLAFLSAGTRYGGWTDIANIGLPQVATAALSGLMYYAAAYWLYLAALRVVPAGVAGAYFNAIPVFGVGLAIVFLGETLTAAQWVNVAAILISVTGLALLTRQADKPIL